MLYQLTMGILHGREELRPELASGAKAVRVGKLIDAVDDIIAAPEVKGMFKDCYGRP